MSPTYRVGIIGCGMIAREHARAWAKTPGVSLVAAADIFPETLNKLCDEFQIAARHGDYRELLRGERLDIISVATWLGSHAEVVIAAAEAGAKGILCEKAMARNLGEADAMLSACERHDVKLVINHQRRTFPSYVKARELIAAGAIGKPVLLARQAAGGLMNIGAHMVDVMRFLLGDPAVEWVLAQAGRKTDRHERGTRIEDFVSATIAFGGGAHAVLEVDTPEPEMPGCMIITGTEGVMDVSDTKLRIMNRDGVGWRDVEIAPLDNPLDMTAICRGLVRWIEGGPEPVNSARLNRGVLEILMMIYESARRRDPVKPPLLLAESPLELGIADGTFKVEKAGAYDIRSERALGLAVKK